jgi:hypothetical protein
MRSRVMHAEHDDERRRNLELSFEERCALMLEMGEEQLQLFMAANTLERGEAIRRIERARQSGRRSSRCMEEVIDASRPDRGNLKG